MISIKDKLWLFAIIAGILGIITLFTPAWGLGNSIAWLWNLFVNNGVADFIDANEPIYTLGIVSTVIIIIGTVLTLLSGILAKLKDKEILILYIIGGALLITGIIVYMAGTAVEYPTFWRYYTVNVASILPYIGGALGIFAGVMGIMENRG
ncbi:MAG: hypothetical protein ACW986_02715 [Promethearchaeota archaeon]|jgi:hypothetical protein